MMTMTLNATWKMIATLIIMVPFMMTMMITFPPTLKTAFCIGFIGNWILEPMEDNHGIEP